VALEGRGNVDLERTGNMVGPDSRRNRSSFGIGHHLQDVTAALECSSCAAVGKQEGNARSRDRVMVLIAYLDNHRTGGPELQIVNRAVTFNYNQMKLHGIGRCGFLCVLRAQCARDK
jgi:hypothetical protein